MSGPKEEANDAQQPPWRGGSNRPANAHDRQTPAGRHNGTARDVLSRLEREHANAARNTDANRKAPSTCSVERTVESRRQGTISDNCERIESTTRTYGPDEGSRKVAYEQERVTQRFGGSASPSNTGSATRPARRDAPAGRSAGRHRGTNTWTTTRR
jgi:hypothetical protein